MASGDITVNWGERRGQQLYQIAEYKLEIVVANGASEKTEEADIHGMIGFVGFSVPELATADKTANLEIDDDEDYSIYAMGAQSAAAAKKYSAHLQRFAAGKCKFKVTTDNNVTGAKTFIAKWRVM